MRDHKPAVRGLYAIIDSAYVGPEDFADAARRIIKGGARIIQVRAKGLPAETLVRALAAVREATLAAGALLIVNDSVEAARACGADGVHLGQGDGSAAKARDILGADAIDAIIGVSTHNIDEALRAVEDGADYISFGPIFPTRTKKDADAPKGLAALWELARRVPLPVVAIGGITERTAADALRHGAAAVAIISDILLSGDMEAKVASIMSETKGSAEWEKKKA